MLFPYYINCNGVCLYFALYVMPIFFRKRKSALVSVIPSSSGIVQDKQNKKVRKCETKTFRQTWLVKPLFANKNNHLSQGESKDE